MINIYIVLYIILAHYISDYLFQSRYMAKNKSSSNLALLSHVTAYTSVLYFITVLLTTVILGAPTYEYAVHISQWVLLNGVLHFITDYITSREVKQLWDSGREYATFAVMGFDQLLHLTTLLSTYQYIVG